MGKIAPTWTVDGFTFNAEAPYLYNPSEYDENGWASIVTKESGWISGPKPKTNRTSRTNANGSYRGPSYADERIITIEGKTWTRTPEDRERAEVAIAAICSNGAELYEITRTTETVQQTMYVELDDAVLVEMDNFNQIHWSLQFCAPDPRKFDAVWQQPVTGLPYGGGAGLDFSGGGLDFDPQFLDFGGASSSGHVQVGNRGNDTGYPLFVITGPVVNPQVFEPATGTTLRFTGTLEDSDVLTINCDISTQRDIPGRGVFVNNARRRGSLAVVGQWPSVPPGAVATYEYVADNYTASSTMQCFFRSAYL